MLDRRSGRLRLAPAAGAGVVRMEPRVRGFDYGPAPDAAPAQALDREGRIDQNRRRAASGFYSAAFLSMLSGWPPAGCAVP